METMKDLFLIVGLAFTVVGILLRIRMRRRTSMVICARFWLAMLVGIVLLQNYWLVPGLLCNAAATLANEGTMPVFNCADTIKLTGFHVRGQPNHRLQCLCDKYAGASIGDFLILGALVGSVVARFV
jgi:hypothetical protein